MKCNSCGRENREGTQFCTYCGKKVEFHAGQCPQCGEQYAAGQKYCFSCGACFQPVVTEEKVQKPEKKKNQFMLPLLIIGITIAALIICVALGVFDRNKPEPLDDSEPVQTEEPANTPEPPEESDNVGSKDVSGNADVEELVNIIREKYYHTQSVLDSCTTEEYVEGVAYYENGDLVMLKLYPDGNYYYTNTHTDTRDCERWCYYDGSEVYFIYMYNRDNGHEYRLYYHNGKLIRWIDPDGKVYDESTDDKNWQKFQPFADQPNEMCDNM